MTYAGDAHLVLSTKVQANPLSKKPPPTSLGGSSSTSTSPSDLSTQSPFLSSRTTSTGLFPSSPSSRGILFAAAPLIVPMELRLSQVKLRAIVVLVVSKTKGITLVFKNDPLESLEVSSTFDSVAVIQKYLQQEIEHQLREMFREDLPGIIHRLSQRWLSGDSEKKKKSEQDSSNSNVRESGVPKSVSDPQNLANENSARTGRSFSTKDDTTPRAKSKSRKSGLANTTPGHSPSTSPRNHQSSNFNKKAPSNVSGMGSSPRIKSSRKSNNNLSGNPSTYTRPGHTSKAASTSAAKLHGELQNATSSSSKGGFASFFSSSGKDSQDDRTSTYGSTFDSMFNTSGFQEIENYDPTYGLRPDDLPVRGSDYSGLGKLAGMMSGGLGDLISDPTKDKNKSFQHKSKGKERDLDNGKSTSQKGGSNSSIRNSLTDEDDLAQNGDISGSFGSSYSRRRNLNSISAERERERENSQSSHRPSSGEMKVGLDAIQVPGGGIENLNGSPFSDDDENQDEESGTDEDGEGEESGTTSEDEEDEEEDDVDDLDNLGHFDRSHTSSNRYEDDVEDDYTSQTYQNGQDEEPNEDYSRYGYPPPGAAFSDTSLGEPINFGNTGMGTRTLFGRKANSNKSFGGTSRPNSPKVNSSSNKARSSYSNHRRNDSNNSSSSQTTNPKVQYETIKAVGGGTITRPRVYHIASRIQAPEIEDDDYDEDDLEDDESTRLGNATLRAGSSSSNRGAASTAKAMSRGSGSGNGESYGKRTGVAALDGRNDLRTVVGDRSNSSFHLHAPIASRTSRQRQALQNYDDVEDYNPSIGRSRDQEETGSEDEDEDPYGYKDNAYHHKTHSRQPTEESDDSRSPSLATLDPEPMDIHGYEYKTQLYREKYGATYRAGYGGSKSSNVDSNDHSNSDISNSFDQSTAPTSAEYHPQPPRSSTPNIPSKNLSQSPNNKTNVNSSQQVRPSMSRDASAHFQDLITSGQTLSPFARNLDGFAVRSAPGSGHGYSNSITGRSNNSSLNGKNSSNPSSTSPTRSHISLPHNGSFNRNSNPHSAAHSHSSSVSSNGKVPRRRTFQLGGGNSEEEKNVTNSLPASPIKNNSPIRRPSASSRSTSLDLERGSLSGGSGEGFMSPTRQRFGRGVSERGKINGWESIRE